MKGIIFLTVSALIYTVVTTFIFFRKDKINKVENRIFKRLLIITNLSMIAELSIVFTTDIRIVSTIIQKGFLVILLLWLAVFMTYTFAITTFDEKETEEKNIEKYKCLYYIFIFIHIMVSLLICILPLQFNSIGDAKYMSGPAVNVVFVTLGIYVSIMGILVLIHIKNIHKKGYIPIISLIVLLTLVGIIQKLHPEMLLSNAVFGFIIYLMSHTIENSDLKLLRQMELAKDQAEKANRAKSDFLSSMSHEIRTPLNAIVGFSEDIQRYKDKATPEVIEDATYILEASNTLLEIVGNILDINKIESNKMEIVEKPYHFKKEIESLAKIDAIRIGEKPIDFKVNIAPDIPYELIGDKTHMKEIINNLLTNAIKYTEKGQIELTAKCINQNDMCHLIISVKDTGRGIKAENINKLFTKFERLDIEKNSTTEGTGLGLAITKSLVEMMGGKINVQSQFGKGSIFMVQIPQKIGKQIEPIEEDKNLKSHVPSVEDSKKRKEMNEYIDYSNKRVLIVDDNALNIKVARRALSAFSLEIEECENGKICLEKIRSGEKYDLILMDIMMPVMSGETALKKMKEIEEFDTPVIALTADAVAGAREKYLDEGFIDYIAKPFNRDQIKEKLDIIFEGNNKIIKRGNNDIVVKVILDMSKSLNKIELIKSNRNKKDLLQIKL